MKRRRTDAQPLNCCTTSQAAERFWIYEKRAKKSQEVAKSSIIKVSS